MDRFPDTASAEETRGLIVEEAMRLFAHYGYSKTNISDIARACGMSAGNLYRYFRNKQAIGIAVVARFFDAVDRCVAEQTDPAASAEARIRFVITESVMHTVRELRQAPKIVELSEMICEIEDGMAFIAGHTERCRARLELLVAEGVAAGEFRVDDPARAARALQMGTKFFRLPFAIARHGLDRIEDDLALALDLLCAGLREGGGKAAHGGGSVRRP